MKWTDLPQSLPHFQVCMSHSPLNCGIVPLLSPFISGDSDDQTDVDLYVRRGLCADGMLGADGALGADGILFFLIGFEMGPLDDGFPWGKVFVS